MSILNIPDAVRRILGAVEQRFPGLQITGTFCPPFRALNQDEVGQLQDKVHAAKADIFWVGLSTPKQERFMAEYLPQLDTSVMVGVGAAFDFHSGRVKQAPAWIQQNGLEWLYRVMQEPRRLWRQYFSIVPRFILLVGAEKSLGRSAFVPDCAILVESLWGVFPKSYIAVRKH